MNRKSLKLIIIFVICLGLTGFHPIPAQAATCTWTGTTSTAYNVATNWSCGHVPGAADDVVIPPATRHPTISSSINAYAINFTIQADGIIEVNSGARFEVYFTGDAINYGTIQTTDGADSNFFGFTSMGFDSQFINNGTINIYAGQMNVWFNTSATHTGVFAGQYGTIGFLGNPDADQTFTSASQITVRQIFFSGNFDVTILGRVYQSSQNSGFSVENSNVTIQSSQPVLLGSISVSGGSLRVIMSIGVGMSALTLSEGAVLEGDGTVSDYLINGGTVSPGASPGEIIVSGDFTQEPTGILKIELGGTEAVVEHDKLSVTQLATLDGTLEVSLINDFSPLLGDTFLIMSYGTHNGEFVAHNLPDLPAGLSWQVAYGETGMTLMVVEEPLRLFLPIIVK